MPISFDARNHRWRYFFDRKVGAERKRTSRLLPKGWDRYKAQEFDRIETARLYALATGVTKPEHLIDAAVLLYLKERGPNLKNRHNLEIAIDYAFAQQLIPRRFTVDELFNDATRALK